MDFLKRKMDIKFTFSYQLQNAIAPKDALPSPQQIAKNIKILRDFWVKHGFKIEQSFKKHTGLTFTSGSIICYINTSTSFSNPLTITIENSADMKDTLIHELIHQLFMQNEESDKNFARRFKKYWNHKLFSKESRLTRSHIYLHAIHLLLVRDLFPKREKAITSYSKKQDYIRAWEIVNELGPENILSILK